MENRYLRNVGPSLWDGAKAPHHPGNVRAVVSDADSVEQVNHYYPFGILMGESRGGDVQRRKFGGKELDREWGLDLFDFEARRFDGMRFTQPDPLAENYPDISPYAFCLNNPLRNIDQHGDSVCVLISPNAVGGLGHAGILIQNKDLKWALLSKNGEGKTISGSIRPGEANDTGTAEYVSPQQFLESDDNVKNGERIYSEGYVIATSKEEDRRAEAAVLEKINEPYHIVGSNCIQAVQAGLKAAGLDTGKLRPTPNNDLTLSLMYKYKAPNNIYKRIKRRNNGTVVR